MHDITLILGDGIGPEVMLAAKKVIDATGVKINWNVIDTDSKRNEGLELLDYLVANIKDTRIALKGPIKTPVGKGYRSINVGLRQKLNLYANIRPIKSFKGIDNLHQNVDLIIVRENTEDLYAGIEHMVGEDAAESIKIITRKASERICKFAFDLAKSQGRKKVTLVHKANIMKLSDGLFLDCGVKYAGIYRDIEFEDVIVDAMSMKLVQYPQDYDIIVTSNLYGDILSDLSAGIIGGLGLAPGANIGDDIAVFEAVHGTAPDIAGKNIANPTSAILSGAMMLKHIGENSAAIKIEKALTNTFKDDNNRTMDLGGNLGTEQFTQSILENIR